jgi:hypothetical protein
VQPLHHTGPKNSFSLTYARLGRGLGPPDDVDDFLYDVAAVNRIEAVPTILEIVCRTTGMGFAAVARVTKERWMLAVYGMK